MVPLLADGFHAGQRGHRDDGAICISVDGPDIRLHDPETLALFPCEPPVARLHVTSGIPSPAKEPITE
jgi:hypothetical protein